MLEMQQTLPLSPYAALYDLLIPKDHFLRQVHDLIDFSFVEEELMDKYCLNNGRMAEPPVRMFKYLFLKAYYDLSDRDVTERAKFDMSFKYFLDIAPEDEVIHHSLLSKFRRQRLKDVDLLKLLIKKSVQLALEKGVLKSTSVIMDATHTVSKYNKQTPVQILRERAKQLRKSVYAVKEEMKEEFPEKPQGDDYEKEMEYCRSLLERIKKESSLNGYQGIQEKYRLLEETMEDTAALVQCTNDADARTGHKSSDTAFFGYKTHIGMSDERIITAAIVTSGEQNDGQYMKQLLEMTEENGIKVEKVIGDTAYSSKENIEHCQGKGIQLVSRLNPTISHKNNRNSDKFSYNKDAGMYVCPAGHMAVWKRNTSTTKSKENARLRFYFDVEKCRRCPYKEGCYTEGAKSRSFSVSILCDAHGSQQQYQETEEFKESYKKRYKIEAKNNEIKTIHGYAATQSYGITGMELQGAATLFCVNIKRIIKLLGEKNKEKGKL